MSLKNKVSLKLAEIIITFQSELPHEAFSRKELKYQFIERFKGLLYHGRKKADIVIDVFVVDELPVLKEAQDIYATYHPDTGEENWRIARYKDSYVYSSFEKDKEQVVFVNRPFNACQAYVCPKKRKGFVWNVADLIYDFLQILLINYLASRKEGILAHAVGIRDADGRGWLFAGKSGAGKSTIARLWHGHEGAQVLNDDRIIIRRFGDRFFMYGSPWHGDFSDYLKTCAQKARLKDIFFIHHGLKNIIRPVSGAASFRLLYPAIIPVFWDDELIRNIIIFCERLIDRVACFHFGFKNDGKLPDFVRTNQS